jgi:hypothetical protein
MNLQSRFDIGIVMVTVVRPRITQAIRSVYAQQFAGRIHLVVGIDKCLGERAVLDAVIAEAPSNVGVTVIDLGYSTSTRHGGLYPNNCGGALKTMMSFAANSRYVGYLDDDNWYAPDHVASMLDAVRGKAWAFSLRNFVHEDSDEVICPDTWESVGPGRGVYGKAQGGFVDTNCFVLDASACYDAFAEWAVPRYQGGIADDRQLLSKIANRPWGTNDKHTVYYRIRLGGHHPYLLWRFRCAGVDLARFMPADKIPGEDVWRQCAEHDRAQSQG